MTFVVTQDPLDTTVVDFWRMIVEHGVSTIVMLSELGCSPTQTKCHPYWPVNSELICEYVKVKFLKEEANDFYIRRDFEIFNTKVSFPEFLNRSMMVRRSMVFRSWELRDNPVVVS